MSLLTADILSWIGYTEPPMTVEVCRREIIKYALATEQQRQSYLDGDEAPPMFVFNLFRPLVPMDALAADGLPPTGAMPSLPLARRMAGGMRLVIHKRVRCQQVLTGVRRIADIFEKNGRQGPLIFLVNELRVVSADDDLVMQAQQTRIAR